MSRGEIKIYIQLDRMSVYDIILGVKDSSFSEMLSLISNRSAEYG
jgi:hypothetical protein